MECLKNNSLFPGQEKGIIRVFIQHKNKEQTVQLHFDFFNDELTKM
jgi:hypothetical protein